MAINKVVYGGNTLIDLNDDTVSASDVASSVTFHTPSGTKTSGTLDDCRGQSITDSTVTLSVGSAWPNTRTKVNFTDEYIVGPSTSIDIGSSGDLFGTATTSEVLKGKTFTSAAGKKVTGTYVPLDTSDATATASDILSGKTAYVNAQKVTGTYVPASPGFQTVIPGSGTTSITINSGNASPKVVWYSRTDASGTANIQEFGYYDFNLQTGRCLYSGSPYSSKGFITLSSTNVTVDSQGHVTISIPTGSRQFPSNKEYAVSVV